VTNFPLLKEKMMATQDKIEKWSSKDGWRYRIRAANGRILAASEAYSTKGVCTRVVNAFVERHPEFEVVEVDE
jgi:uncharacterized protein YegP (UPF0339 family)